MASKKEKFLESAQRFVLKGQIDRAIRDYQQVVAMDPGENRYRQKLAELLVRDGRKDEAIEQYEDIARNYADNSYYLKAIAVYKQIQRLAPANTRILFTLATLNHKQGLTGNALAEYAQVVAALEKEGDLKKAIEALEQMISIDAHNLSTRLKHGELLRRSGEDEAAFKAFGQILKMLELRGDHAAAEKFLKRLRQMYPEKSESELSLPHFDREWQAPSTAAPQDRGAEPENGGAPVVAELPLSLDEEVPEPAAQELSEVAAAEVTAGEEPAPWEVEIELDLDEEAPLHPAPARAEAPETPPFPEPLGAPTSSEASVELELDDALDWPEEEDAVAKASEEAPQLFSWRDIFPSWEEAAAGKVDPVEAESHYDLGVAYREMGLLKEAVKELQEAGVNPRRRLDSLTLQAICYREMGDLKTAEELLSKGLSLRDLAAPERMHLSFELATLYEACGKWEEAVALFREVHDWDPSFRDVGRRLGFLGGEEEFEEIELDEEL